MDRFSLGRACFCRLARLRDARIPGRNRGDGIVIMGGVGKGGLARLESTVGLVFVVLKFVKSSFELTEATVQRSRHIVLDGVDVFLQGCHVVIQRFQLFGHLQFECRVR
jgi:hypothetical protein